MKLNNTSHPQLIGVFISFLIIWQIHDFFVVDDCINQGGSFDYKTGFCTLIDGGEYQSVLPDWLIGSYFIIAIVAAFAISKSIKYFLNQKNKKS